MGHNRITNIASYFGGGVGHYQVSVLDEDADELNLPDDDEDLTGSTSDLLANKPEETDLDSDKEKEEEEEEDKEEEEEEDKEEDKDEGKQEDKDLEPQTNEEEFGPDDGEDGVDDLTAQFGYDEL
jgi:hypothetical protein